jgi:hypothetical protein
MAWPWPEVSWFHSGIRASLRTDGRFTTRRPAKVLACEKPVAVFDAPNVNYPKQWKDYSLDFQLMFVFHGGMMVLFMAGSALTVRQELLATGLLAATLVSISLRNRREKHWRWPGVDTKRVLGAVGGLALAAYFDFAATPLGPHSDPRFLPWHLAGLGLAVFGVLLALRVVHFSKADFLKDCEAIGALEAQPGPPAEPSPALPTDLLWKRVARGTFQVLFLLVWLAGVTSFYEFGAAFRDGSPRPTPTHTEPLNNHGEIRYIPHSQKVLVDFLQTATIFGILSVLVFGLILHFVVGVRVFANAPTLAEWRRQRLKA